MFRAHVRIGRTREELLAHLDAAVESGLTRAEVEAQTALASTMTWDATLRRVQERVEAMLAGGGLGAPHRPRGWAPPRERPQPCRPHPPMTRASAWSGPLLPSG